MVMRRSARPAATVTSSSPALPKRDAELASLVDLYAEQDIPPAIACARCGRSSCEGCEPAVVVISKSTLPWEQPDTAGALFATALLTVENPAAAFAGVAPLRWGRALSFSVLSEFLAVSSFALPWTAGFYLVFPRVARDMADSPLVWLTSALILVALVAFVVFVHLAWGVILEWAVGRQGQRSDYALGIRFGLYACGWDLVTSPMCFGYLTLKAGPRRALRSIAAAAAATRSSLHLYLHEARALAPEQASRASRLALIVTIVFFFATICLGFFGLFWYLLAANGYL